jgi:hypothetical protein
VPTRRWYIGNDSTDNAMTDAPAPAPPAAPAAVARFDPTWAFGGAAASLACAFVGAHLVSTNASPSLLLATIATVLASIVVPGWLAVGVVLAQVAPNGAWPTPRARALTILAAIVLALFGLSSIAILLWLASTTVGASFVFACVVALVFLNKALSAAA